LPEKTNIDFFRFQWLTFGGSMVLTVLSPSCAWAVMGLNFGIDFRGRHDDPDRGTQPVDVGAYRAALAGWTWAMCCDHRGVRPDIRRRSARGAGPHRPQDGAEAVTPGETIAGVEAALQAVDPAITFPSVESVGAKVSGELIWKAIWHGGGGDGGILIYIWLRFEWQFAVGACWRWCMTSSSPSGSSRCSRSSST
jgi:preprotein translocase subunit SecF